MGIWEDWVYVHHWCDISVGCCTGPADTKAQFKKLVAPALAGILHAIFARSRWHGVQRAVDQQVG